MYAGSDTVKDHHGRNQDMSSSSKRAGKRSLWQKYLAIPLIWKLLTGLVLGIIAGLIFREDIQVISPLGDLFLRLLSMLILPLILTTLLVGITSVSAKTLGRVGTKVFGFYLLTTTFAIAIGMGLAMLVSPGQGLTVSDNLEAEEKQPPEIAEVFLDIFPSNVFEALSSGQILAVLFVTLIVGFALNKLLDSDDQEVSEGARILKKVLLAAQEIVYVIVRGVLEYSPIGVFALIAVTVGSVGMDALLPLGKLILVVYVAIAIMLIVYALLNLVFKQSPAKFFAAAKEPMLTAFVTRSSGGTLPVTSRAADKLGIPRGIHSFTLPLGATINMDGTAIYVGASVIFVADAMGTTLTAAELVSVILVGVLASIGTAGVPGAGLIMLTMAVGATGLPMAPVALIAGIDVVLDMVRTMCNVTGDLAVTNAVAQTERKNSNSSSEDATTH